MAVQYAFGKIITQGLDLNVDAADPTSYPGSGTSWTNVVNRSITGSLISCSFSSDFKGGIVFNNPTASVVFPGTVANYGTGSFTVEMAFRPTQINGIHYLVSKNSGSFPNWGVYLSGSGGSGKLFSFYNISSTVSCSVSSSTTFVTGSNYFVDAILSPVERRIYLTINGEYDKVSNPSNGTGSLTTTSSLFVGNLIVSSSQAYSGSLFNFKTYSIFNLGNTNFRTLSYRLQQPIPLRAGSALALIIGGGGGGGAGGGGGGGFVISPLTLTPGSYNVFVGDGGAANTNGQTSSLAGVVAYGGGRGGAYGSGTSQTGSNGGSGGGGGATNSGNLIVSGGLAIYFNESNLGNNGGNGQYYVGGGGGGAGGNGTNGTYETLAGRGGIGMISNLSGTSLYYAGGGGAGGFGGTGAQPGSGSLGGGGNGSMVGTGQTGSVNTGGGGGGGSVGAGGKGGSGIIIIRYPGPPIATGGTITQVGGDTIHTFTATGSHTFTVF